MDKATTKVSPVDKARDMIQKEYGFHVTSKSNWDCNDGGELFRNDLPEYKIMVCDWYDDDDQDLAAFMILFNDGIQDYHLTPDLIGQVSNENVRSFVKADKISLDYPAFFTYN